MTSPFITAQTFDGTTSTCAVTNASGTTTTAGNVASSGHFYIANTAVGARYAGSLGYYWFGDVGEVLVFNSVLSAADIAAVRTYLASKWFGVGTSAPGSLPVGSAVSIAAGATLDVSGISAYTLGTGASLTARGTGTTPGADAAAITGTVSLGSRPVSLVWGGNLSGMDSTHPPLVVSQGTLSLGGNTFTVVVPGTALGNGVYTLVTTPSTISGTVNATPSFTGGNGLASGGAGVVSISGSSVVLTVTGATGGYASWASNHGLTGTPGDGSGTDPAFDADPNKDGIQNGMAWILGAGALGDPAANLLKLPAVSRDGTGAMILTFDRLGSSDASAPLVVQYSDNLGATPWTDLAVGASGGTDGNITIAVATGGGSTAAGYDRITVTIPATYMAAHPKTFARLMATHTP